MKTYKFTIVGSGTAGWITALFLARNYPWANITVISSSDIGILGAGEGVTPHFIHFLNKLGIDVADIIKYCKGTFKNGIKFTNWNGDTRSYFHPFHDEGSLNCFNITDYDASGLSAIVLDRIVNANSIDECIFSHHVSEQGKVKLKPNLLLNKGGNLMSQYDSLGNFGLHFDAVLLAKYLKRIAVSKRIRYIDDEVDKVLTNEEGYVNALQTVSGDVYETDFVFDCSGTQRLIIGKHFNTPWKSYKESLPVNKAMPFFLPHDNTNILPYTEAIAMKYGWVWKIPVEGRYGCGYVYDSDLVSDEQILEEIKEMFGQDVESPRIFEFEAGRYETPWVKNCIAIGLSAGFIEPLEATSIMTAIMSLGDFIPNTLGNVLKDEYYINRYNKFVTNVHDNTFDFIFLHYLTKREDTEFWKSFKDRPMPEAVQQYLEECKYTIPNGNFVNKISHVYENVSWLPIAKGLRILNIEKAANLYSGMNSDIRREEIPGLSASFYGNMQLNLNTLADHSELLKIIRES
jgi:tryptophan halogenase